jgi:putative ABC transport system permease protein
MTRHLLRLVWNRKRSTALLLAELFVTFLVVTLVTTIALYLATNWRRPLGFDYRNVLAVSIDYERTSDDFYQSDEVAGFARLLAEARTLAEVESAAGSHVAPFDFGNIGSDFELDGVRFDSSLDEVTDEFLDVMRLELVAGRWFGREDDGAGGRPVVIDADLARSMFGSSQAAVGRLLHDPSDDVGESGNEHVIGVVSDYRSTGELTGVEHFFFRRVSPGEANHRPLGYLLLRVRPGTGVDFEPRLVERLRQIAPTWSFEVRPLAEMRADALRVRAIPIAAGGIVASFLLAMVALGLAGVVWQNVVERTREIGLRRALGATGRDVHRQFVLEIVLLAALALVAGVVVVLQLPILGLVGGKLQPAVLAGGLATAILLLTAIAAAAAWLPSRMASRVPPSEALRYE